MAHFRHSMDETRIPLRDVEFRYWETLTYFHESIDFKGEQRMLVKYSTLIVVS